MAVSKANSLLIREHYRNMGCYRWNRERFQRLCGMWQETPEEMGARVGLAPREVTSSMEHNSFSQPAGILLTFHLRYIETALTGRQQPDELFPPKQP